MAKYTKNGGVFKEQDYKLVKELSETLKPSLIRRVTGWSLSTISAVQHTDTWQDYVAKKTERYKKIEEEVKTPVAKSVAESYIDQLDRIALALENLVKVARKKRLF